ncbi:MAG: peptidylprolyl isomerase [Rubrivivax sp.]
MTDSRAPGWPAAVALAAATLLACWQPPAHGQGRPTTTDRAAERAADRSAVRTGDYIVAVVNQELVTAVEVQLRMQRVREEAQRGGARLPPEAELRQRILDALIEERVILTFARENGARIEDPELDRAVQAVAANNQLTVEGLRDRLRAEGLDFTRYRANLRDQLMVERTREREVLQRIRVTDAEIDRYLEQQRTRSVAEASINLAQILVTVPEGASPQEVAARRALAERALERVRAGEPFEAVARQVSEDGNRQRGGEIGMRPASRLPDLFVEATRGLKVGEVTPALVRSGAGFHVLKLLERDAQDLFKVTQSRVRHILLRPSPRLNAEQAQARLATYRARVESGESTFEDLARQYSEDGSSVAGGDLGWASPGMMVPEFEEAMNALPVGGLSRPVTSRFGVHLIQVQERRQVDLETRQVREQARNALREQKFEEAYADWARDLRGRAYIELREPPL